MAKLKFKKMDWTNINTDKVRYGIDAKKEGDKNWMHLAINGKPYFARKEECRDKAMKKLIKENK